MNEEIKTNGRGMHMMFKLIGMLLLAGIIIVSILRDRIVANQMWQVSVVGRSEIAYTPDLAKVNIGFHVDKAADSKAAVSRLNEAMAKVIEAISKEGVDKKDMETLNYNLYPQYNYVDNNSVVDGYGADQQIIVTVRDVAKKTDLVSKVMSAATGAGANQINSVSFETTNIGDLKQQARIKAIADAKSKAGELSKAAGVRLGKVVGWWESIVQGPDMYGNYIDGKGAAMGMGGGVTPPTVPSGEYKLIMEMNLNYMVK